MTNPVLNNKIANDSVILWQYDKAVNLIRLIQAWNRYATVSCEHFWNYFGNSMFPIDRADTYGLNIWGNLLGIPRPTIKIPIGSDIAEGGVDYETVPDGEDSSSDDSSESTEDRFDNYGYDEDGYRVSWVEEGENAKWKIVTIKNTLYRGLLKGRFFLMCHPPTVPNYNRYLAIVFGVLNPEDSDSSDSDSSSAEAEIPDYDIFDENGEVNSKDYLSRNCALDFQNMTMGFTFPENATTEEAYLIFQHYDLVFPFPAGIRYPGAFIDDELVIGLNQGNATGQMYKNLVDGLVLAAEDSSKADNPNGGIFSATKRANYKVTPTVSGKAFIFRVSDGSTLSITAAKTDANDNNERKVWIDWGNGECGYNFIQPLSPSRSFSPDNRYSFDGLVAVTVFFPADMAISSSGYENSFDISS